MIYSFAEINPSIVFFILWGLLSWITKNREKNAKLDNSKTIASDAVLDNDFDQENYFEYSQDIFENAEEYVKEEDLVSKSIELTDDEILFEKDEPPVESAPIIDEIYDSRENNSNWLKNDLSNKTKIKKYLIFSEILKKPRSLNPY
jgi:hypothetical protein